VVLVHLRDLEKARAARFRDRRKGPNGFLDVEGVGDRDVLLAALEDTFLSRDGFHRGGFAFHRSPP